jgi:hypothetical protein
VNEIVNIPTRREVQSVVDPVPVLDTSRFEHMQRVANIMARSSMIPESLRTEGRGNDKTPLPFEQVMANCFLVVNQAVRWGFDPFAVISCCAVVHGRLAYEGKLVSAVIDAKLNIKLHHHFVGDTASESCRIYLSDQPFTAEIIEQLKPGIKIPGLRLWDGSVAEWKTTGTGTPWTPKNFPRMLIYRGTRDWTRIYEPAVLLGVYTDDELIDLADDARARRATPVVPVTLADRLAAAKTPGIASSGFSHDHVTRETEVQREAADRPPPPVSMASAQEPESSGSEGVQDRCESTPSPVSNSVETPPGSQPDTPAGVASSPQPPAGTNSEDSPAGRASGEGGGDDAASTAGDTSSPPLPEGWGASYAAALRRAQKRESLPKYASQFWDQHGGWEAHKSGVNGPTATAIFDAFKDNFGDKDAIEAQLREII